MDRDWWTYIGLTVIAVAAAVMSFAAWSGLAVQVGMDQRTGPFHLAWLLPLSVDAYAMIATRVWLMDQSVTDQTRTSARRAAVGAIALSFAGNALFHLVTVLRMQAWPSWWVVVVLVTGLPAVMFGQAVYLRHRMRSDQRSTVRSASSSAGPAVSSPDGPAGSTTGENRSNPVPVRPGPPAGVRSSQTTEDRLAVLRDVWPTSVPTKREVMDRLSVRSSSGAVALVRRHRDWIKGQATTPSARALTVVND